MTRRTWDPDERRLRMNRAVELRAEGLSLRVIAARLHCTEGTVRNDLRTADHALQLRNPVRNQRSKAPPDYAADCAPGAAGRNVIPLRRSS